MADKNFGIQTGSRVDVKYSFNTDSDTASIFDQGYTEVKELAQFPEVKRAVAMAVVENYDSDYTGKLHGDINVTSTQLVVNEVPGDETQQALKEAADNRKLVRFQNIYVIDSGEDQGGQQQGFYQIYDAYVSGYKRQGGEAAVAQLAFNIEPTGKILAEGISQTGEVLRQGDFGVGAGTVDFPGPKDTSSFIGNSWRTFMGSNGDNPIKVDTTLIHSQPNENRAWQLTGPVDGFPGLYVRNIQKNGTGIAKSGWAKVYTDLNKPTAADVKAVAKAGDTMSGDLSIQTNGNARLKINESMIRVNKGSVNGGGNDMVLSTNKSPIHIRPLGDGPNGNMDFKFDIDGVFSAPTVTAQAVKVAIQGKANNDVVRYDTWNNKSYQKIDGLIEGAVKDWNELTDFGTYKIHGATGPNSPSNLYAHGMLNVYMGGQDRFNENRVVQVYYPHRSGLDSSSTNGMAYRIRVANQWTAWSYVRTQAYNDANYLKLSGVNKMTGNLELNGQSLRFMANGLDVGLAQSGKVFLGDTKAATDIRTSGTDTLVVELPGARRGKVYTEFYKPTGKDLGLITPKEVDDQLDGRLIPISTIANTPQWVRVGTVQNFVRNGRILTLIGAAGAGYNGRAYQNGTFEVMLKTGDSSVTGVNAIGRAALSVVNNGTGVSIQDAGVIEVAANKYEIWLKFGAFVATGWCRITSGNEAFIKQNWISDGKTLQPATPTFVMETKVVRGATTDDVDSIWNTDGTFTKEITFDKGLVIQKASGGSVSKIVPGNGDAASYETCNFDIRGHNGMGFYNNVTNNGVQGRVGYVDFRSGSMRMAGNITSDGVIAIGVSQKSPGTHTVATWDRGRQRMRFATDDIGVDIHAKTANDVLYVGPAGINGVFINTLNAQQQLGSGFVSKTDTKTQDIKSSLNIGGAVKPNTILDTFNANTPDADPSVWKDGIEILSTTNTVNGWPLGTAVGLKFKAAMHRHGQLLIGQNNEFMIRSLRGDRPAASNTWTRVFTVDDAPAPNQLKNGGAYTKAEADGKYFLKSGGNIAGSITVAGNIIGNQINANYGLGAKGGGNPGAYGAYVQWGVTNTGSGAPTGAMQFINHYGPLTNAGGWIWESKGDGQPNQKKAMLLTKDGDLTLQGQLSVPKQADFGGVVNLTRGSRIVANRSDFAINAIEVTSDNWLNVGDVKSSMVVRALNFEVMDRDNKRGKVFSEINPPTAAQVKAVAQGEVIDEGTF